MSSFRLYLFSIDSSFLNFVTYSAFLHFLRTLSKGNLALNAFLSLSICLIYRELASRSLILFSLLFYSVLMLGPFFSYSSFLSILIYKTLSICKAFNSLFGGSISSSPVECLLFYWKFDGRFGLQLSYEHLLSSP